MAKQKVADLRPDQYDKWLADCIKKYHGGHIETHGNKEHYVFKGETVGRFDWDGLAKDDFIK